MTISELTEKFGTNQDCLKYILELRGGFSCKKCGGKKYHSLRKRPIFVCSKCLAHNSVTRGTIFENSKTPLPLWFYAIFLMSKTKSGISAKQLHRELGVTYKCAWRMNRLIRSAMRQPDKLDGEVIEVDETYVGGKEKNRARKYYAWRTGEKSYQSKKLLRKEIVMGMIERGGRVKAVHIKSMKTLEVFKNLPKHISKESIIMTDEHDSYKFLPMMGYDHRVINHKTEFRNNEIYTQNIENFWSHMKRGITGVYRKTSAKHLQSYVDEFVYRYNHRKEDMFYPLLSSSVEPLPHSR